MDKNILNQILDAEKRADQIMEKAEETAREILIAGREKSADILKETQKRIFAQQKELELTAQKISKEHSDRIIAQGKERAEQLIKASAAQCEKAAQYIVEEALKDKWL